MRLGDWWDKSWNVVTGCNWDGEIVPAGCERCWEERMCSRFDNLHSSRWSLVKFRDSRLDIPLRRKKPTIWATSLLGDIFHPHIMDMQIDLIRGITQSTPQHRFFFLSKRWRRAVYWFSHDFHYQTNCTLLCSIWNQSSYDSLKNLMKSCAPRRWGLHIEPLIGGVHLASDAPQPDWLIVGKENGPGARRFDRNWGLEILEFAQTHNIPFWDKSGFTKDLIRERPRH